MRIDSLGRTDGGSSAARPAARGGVFDLSDVAETGPARAASPLRQAPSLDALIALQALPDDTCREKKRRELKRGRHLLDALDGMKLALFDGADDPTALAAIAARLAERRGATGEAGLDETLSAIELRARRTGQAGQVNHTSPEIGIPKFGGSANNILISKVS